MTRITKDSAQFSDLETIGQFLDILPTFSFKQDQNFDKYFEEKSIAITTAMKQAGLRADRHRHTIDKITKEKPECFEIQHMNTGAQKIVITQKGEEFKKSLKVDLEGMEKILLKYK
jgi:predicted transcriptional regulator